MSRLHSTPPLLLASLSGVLGGLAFPRPGLDVCIWFCLVPLLIAVQAGGDGRGAVSKRVGLGWVTAVLGFLITFPWVAPATARLQQISLTAAMPLFLGFVAYHAVQVGLFAALAAWALRRWLGVLGCVVVAATWVALEWLYPKIFPWTFANVLSARLSLIQIVEITGVWGLSFVIVFTNAALACAWVDWHAHRRTASRALLSAVALVVALSGWGWARLEQFDSASGSTVSIAVIQGNLPGGQRTASSENDAMSIYQELTLHGSLSSAVAGDGGLSEKRFGERLPDVDLVLWPEMTLRVYLRDHAGFRERVFDVAAAVGKPLLLGGLDATADRSAGMNSLFVVLPDRSFGGVYHKTRLLLFGETTPLPAGWWHTTGQLVAGDQLRVLNVERPNATRVRLAPSICFEAFVPGFFNSLVRDGAGILVNITDDSWMGYGNAPWQHLQGNILRAVETRRPLIRASNSGISAVVDSGGRIVASTPLATAAVLRSSVVAGSVTTLYARYGDWFAAACVAVVVLATLTYGPLRAK